MSIFATSIASRVTVFPEYMANNVNTDSVNILQHDTVPDAISEQELSWQDLLSIKYQDTSRESSVVTQPIDVACDLDNIVYKADRHILLI